MLKLRRDHAAALFALAQRCACLHQASLGCRLAEEAVRADPDHEAARRVFGYQKYRNQWRTPYEVQMLRGGMVWSDKFGWVEKVNLPRYASGERLFGAAWIDAASDAALHAEITNGWDIETEHYRIRTNHSIEAAVALGMKLENLHRVWRQVFLRYYAGESDMEALFSGRPPANVAAATGGRLFPQPAAVPAGLEADHAGRGHLHGTLRAPEPHGLLLCRQRGQRADDLPRGHAPAFPAIAASGERRGRKANCWLIEGIAMYMESLRREGDCFVLGGLDNVRMEAARRHLEKNDFFVPFDRLVRMGVRDIQGHPQIAKLYSQIAAMASFLVHYDKGRYRDALVRCLAAIYDGNQDPDLLARETGVDYAGLDRQYRNFMAIKVQPALSGSPISRTEPTACVPGNFRKSTTAW